jgi:hypothetical protein
MRTCSICNGKAGFFSKKIYDGYICKKCVALIPQNVSIGSSDKEYLKGLYDKNIEKKKVFNYTASYGSLYIDSSHNMFCISPKHNGAEPAMFGDIYYVRELKEVELFCTDVKNIGTKSNKVVCNVKFRFKTKDTEGEYLITSNTECPFKKVGNQLECSMPSKFLVFRSMFNQMIDNEIHALLRKLEEAKKRQAAMSSGNANEDWARGVLFVRPKEELTKKDLKAKRNMLIKIYHPDLGGEFASEDITAQVNEAYDALMNKAK